MAERLRSELVAASPRFLLDWKEARYFRRHGEIELDLVRDLCRRDDDAIDVGANEGMYVLFMRRSARHVLAFEPLTSLHDKLRRRYDWGVTISRFALSDRPGRAELHVPLAGSEAVAGLASLSLAAVSGHVAHLDLSVETMPLDAIYGGDVGFMKVDVEGHEPAVLDGAARTLERCRPRLLLECDEALAPGSLARVRQRLDPLDYVGFFAHRRALERIDVFDAALHQRAENIAGLGTGRRRRDCDYVNNFIFVPRREVDMLRPRLQAALARS